LIQTPTDLDVDIIVPAKHQTTRNTRPEIANAVKKTQFGNQFATSDFGRLEYLKNIIEQIFLNFKMNE
jgi:hypothetical protein